MRSRAKAACLMAGLVGLFLMTADALAEGRPRFVHEPYVPAPSVAGGVAGASAVGSGGALADASLSGGLAASAFQDDVDWSRRQRQIALQEMWFYYRLGVGGYQRASAQFESFDSSDFDADFDLGLIASFAIGGRYRVWDVGP